MFRKIESRPSSIIKSSKGAYCKTGKKQSFLYDKEQFASFGCNKPQSRNFSRSDFYYAGIPQSVFRRIMYDTLLYSLDTFSTLKMLLSR